MKKLLITFSFLFLQFAVLLAQPWNSLGSGTDAGVMALAMYKGNLIAGGNFTSAGGVPANNIAMWNGTSWAALGTGVNGSVYALAVYNGKLIAGGAFDSAGGQGSEYIAHWDGTSWAYITMNWGLMGGTQVNALTVYNGNLIAAGNFTLADGNSAISIASWNGTGWSALGAGINNSVYTLTVYNGNLIAGGDFTKAGTTPANFLAAWNDTSWSALSSGTGSAVSCLTVYNGDLIAGGDFTKAGGNLANHIASWDGTSWSALGTGTNDGVMALSVYNGNLIAGGYFNACGLTTTKAVAQWNGTTWDSVGGGVWGMKNSTLAFAVNKCTLYGGGVFTMSGDNPINNIAYWKDPGNTAIAYVCCNSAIQAGQTVRLTASGGDSYVWTPSYGLSCDICPEPLASPSVQTTYSVIITNDSGCVFTRSLTVEMTCGSVYIPDAFSPNNDGQNDILYAHTNCVKTLEFIIFDRWGNKVFETENSSMGWDGTYQGKPMNSGTYVYSLRATMQDETSLSRKGNITLVR